MAGVGTTAENEQRGSRAGRHRETGGGTGRRGGGERGRSSGGDRQAGRQENGQVRECDIYIVIKSREQVGPLGEIPVCSSNYRRIRLR